MQIDDGPERAAVAQAEAAVGQARARVEQLRKVGAIAANEALRQTEVSIERAQTELDRTAKLVESRAVPAVEFENAHIK